MRYITRAGLALIQHYEGFSPRIYLCPAGYPTIGYGHVVREYEKFPGPISVEEGTALLRLDVEKAERAVHSCISAPLSGNQFDALVSFTFNLGGAALQRSTLRQKINRGEHEAAPAELMRWIWVLGKKSPGLIKRRQAEGLLYRA